MFIGRVGMTVSILIYIGFNVRWAEIGKQLLRSEPTWLIFAFFLMGVAFLMGSIRWWILLKVQEIIVPLKVVTSLTLIGQFFNSFLLGTTGGDIIKTLFILKYTPNQKARATLSIILDRVMGLFVFLCCALITLPWQIRFLMQREETQSIVYALIVVFVIISGLALFLFFIPFHRLPLLFHQVWEKIPRRDILESFLVGFREHGRSRRLTFEAMVCSVVASFFVFTAGYCISLAIHLEATYIQMVTVLAFVVCITSLPISVGGHGIREGVFVLMFAIYGIINIDNTTSMGQEPAILFSIIFFTLFLGWSLLGGLVYLTFRTSHKNEPVGSPVVPI